MLTFDDAFLDFLKNAYPVLKADQVPCTVFVPTGLVGGTNTWDAALGVESRRPMHRAQIRSLFEEGVVEFGSHTVDHVRMTSVDRLEMGRQAIESKRYLEDLLGAQVECFAYPYGQLDDFLTCHGGSTAGDRLSNRCDHSLGAPRSCTPALSQKDPLS